MNNGAVQDIIMNDRYRGAIDSIKGVTQVCDAIFAIFISFSAFFIISAALLRNVVAGVYASNPRFFTMVDNAKQAAISKCGDAKMGFILKAILKLVPNFKAMSDFADEDVSPKDYFIQAIPKMFAVVMIGVVIYNGFYRDIVGKAANFGSEMISRFITRVDPVAVWDGLTNSIGEPNLQVDGDDSMKGKLIKELTKQAYSQVVSYYTDVTTKEAKAKLGQTIEEYVTNIVGASGMDAPFPDGKYKQKVQTDRIYKAPTDASGVATPPTDDPENIKRFIFYADIKSNFNIDSTMHTGEVCYIRFIVQLEKDVTKEPSINADGSPNTSGGGTTSGGTRSTNNANSGVTYSGTSIVGNTVQLTLSALPTGCKDLRAASAKATFSNTFRDITISGSTLTISCTSADDAKSVASAIQKVGSIGLSGVQYTASDFHNITLTTITLK